MMNAEPLLTIDELAGYLLVSKRTIWRWVKLRRLPEPNRLTRRIRRWRQTDIEAAINACHTANTTAA